MAKFKKVIPALCMLVVSAIMAVSTTYAWFSMNTTVKATGMQVTAKTNSEFFVINDSQSLTGITATSKAASKTAGGIDTTETSVYPCAYATTEVTFASYTAHAGTWYTANSTDWDDAAGDETTKRVNGKAVTEGDAKYMYTYKVWVGFNDKSESGEGTLKITPTITGVNSAVVVFGTEKELLTNGTEWSTTKNTTFTAGTGIEVTIYVFADGNNSTVKSSATTELTGSVELKIDFVPKPTA